ncbi:hypothetical protein V2J09_009866 [Rumex salicifolius]
MTVRERAKRSAKKTFVQEKEVFEVIVEKGMQHGEKITCRVTTDEAETAFVLQQKDHPRFKRKGDDLFYEYTLSSTEALCGFKFILTHLSDMLCYSHIFIFICTSEAGFLSSFRFFWTESLRIL